MTTLALTNLIVQALLAVALAGAVYLAKKHRLRQHCLVMRIAVGVQLVSVAAVMTMSLVGFIGNPPSRALLYAELLTHHSLGIVLVLLFIYINLAYHGVFERGGSFRAVMRTAALTWSLALVLGVHLCVRLYT